MLAVPMVDVRSTDTSQDQQQRTKERGIPVVHCEVSCRYSSDLAKFTQGLQLLSESDPTAVLLYASGQAVVRGSGEVHLETLLDDLEKKYAKVPLIRSELSVQYMESCRTASVDPMLARSPNKKNRLYFTAETLGEDLAIAIQNGRLPSPNGGVNEAKVRANLLEKDYGWDRGHAFKIWAFGPDPVLGPNVLVNMTKGVLNLDRIKESCISAFIDATRDGPLAGETLRGVRFNLIDAVISDETDHGVRQIVPTAGRGMRAAYLSAEPELMEPLYSIEIKCPQQSEGSVHRLLLSRRGGITSVEVCSGTNTNESVIQGVLPVAQSLGFSSALAQATDSLGTVQLVFDHWGTVEGDLDDEASTLGACVSMIRKRKNLGAMRTVDDFRDTL
ncbi:Elongation factor 2, partial [Mortierella alpina]